jgi:hypothetical protein
MAKRTAKRTAKKKATKPRRPLRAGARRRRPRQSGMGGAVATRIIMESTAECEWQRDSFGTWVCQQVAGQTCPSGRCRVLRTEERDEEGNLVTRLTCKCM